MYFFFGVWRYYFMYLRLVDMVELEFGVGLCFLFFLMLEKNIFVFFNENVL